jgi:4-hydroxybenzoate polyprenyltransferase
MLLSLLQLIRVKDWLKNIIVFLPLIFSNHLFDFDKLNHVALLFCIFCLTSSIIYIINDIVDREEDRNNLLKKTIKPLARNSISIFFAFNILLLFTFILIFLLFFNKIIFLHVLIYSILNIFYIFLLKKIPYIDLLVISFGYIIRLDSGSEIINVESSLLIILTIFSLSFFAISMKRSIELINNVSKSSLLYFNTLNLKIATLIGLFSSIFFYSLYILIKNFNLLITFPVVVYFLFRYYLKYRDKNKFSPIDIVFKDVYLSLSIIVYFTLVIYMMY